MPSLTIGSADPVDTYVGTRIRQRRKELALSQTSLALSLGITFQQIQKYERAANRVSASMLVRAAQAMDVPVAWFFDGFPGTVDGASATPPDELERKLWLASEDGRRWAEAGWHLPDHAYRVAIQVAEAFTVQARRRPT